MRIVTLNMWGQHGPWRQRWEHAVRELSRLNLDVLCLQEATAPMLTLFARGVGLSVAAWDADSNLAVLTAKPVQATRTETHPIVSEHEPRARKLLWLQLGDVQLINTHLSYHKSDDACRTQQVAYLAEHLVPDFRSIVCGDFNCEVATGTMQPLLDHGLKDVLSDSNLLTWDNKNPFTEPYHAEYPPGRIDHIFTDLKCKDARVVLEVPDKNGIHASDHYGVLAELD